jgi:hypothetical protein
LPVLDARQEWLSKQGMLLAMLAFDIKKKGLMGHSMGFQMVEP